MPTINLPGHHTGLTLDTEKHHVIPSPEKTTLLRHPAYLQLRTQNSDPQVLSDNKLENVMATYTRTKEVSIDLQGQM